MKQRIRLSEPALHRIIKESVKRVLLESKYDNYFDWSKNSDASQEEIDAAGERHDSRIGSIYDPVDNLSRREYNNKRYKERIKRGNMTPKEMMDMQKFDIKNDRSDGKIYADRLKKALTPNPKWIW